MCGGYFKYKWRLLFCVVLHVAMINVLGAMNEVDLNGYILYCPCMGKYLMIAKYFIMPIIEGYVVKDTFVCIY